MERQMHEGLDSKLENDVWAPKGNLADERLTEESILI